MKKLVTKGLYIIPVIFLFVGIMSPVLAQFTKTNLETGRLYTALAKDGSNNLYVTRVKSNNGGATYEVVKYTNGGGTPVFIHSGLTHETSDYPWGLAVTSTGNVFISTDFSSSGGSIIKLTLSGGTYTGTTYQTGRYFSALAVDANDNLYAAEYDAAHTSYAVVKYPANSAANTAGTNLYDALHAGPGYGYPTGLAVAANGDVFVADAFGNDPSISDGGRVIKLAAASAYAATTLSSGNYASALAIDAAGNLFSSENTGSGYHLTEYISGGFNTAMQYSPMHSNGIYYPWGIAVINSDKIFAIDGDDGVNGGIVMKLTSANANLANLTISSGALTPVFASATTSYTASVSNATTSVTVTPTTADPLQTVTVNGTAVASGSASGSLPLNVGADTITTVATAPDGITHKTYTITVTRAPSKNDDLSKLKINNGNIPLNPSFNFAVTSYTATSAVASVTIMPVTHDAAATVKVNGVAVISGSQSAAIPLVVGPNTITTVVTAQDGITTKTYTISVTRLSPNDDLNTLKINAGAVPLSPSFSYALTSYTATVPNTTTSVKVTPVTHSASATVTVNGTAVASGTASGPIPLNVGKNTIATTVTAQDGISIKTYTITVTRISANALLANLTISIGALSPVFDPATNNYADAVSNKTLSGMVTPTTADSNATVTVNGSIVASGTPSYSFDLNVGPNTVTVVVTAQDGTTTDTYTVTVNRAPSSNDDLSTLKIDNGNVALSPAFNFNTTSYTASVPHSTTTVNILPVAHDINSTLTVNGTAVASGASSPVSLAVGQNVITTIVTAQDGTTTKTYTITVTRISSNTDLSNLKINAGAIPLSPSFNYTITSYTASVTNSTASVKITPVTHDATSTVTVNGTAVASGTASQSIALNTGDNAIMTVVTAQDGVSTKTYTITVTRAGAPVRNLNNEVGVAMPVNNPRVADDGIFVHQGFSPNGDGTNDYLVIDGIANYPENKLMIVNRNGSLVYSVIGYDNNSRIFDGHSNRNGKLQLPGTYFYSLAYKVNGVVKYKTGFIVLKY